MRNILLDKWLEALRSGKYDQTRGALYDGRGYCCLGVLCDLVTEEFEGGWGDRTLNEDGENINDDGIPFECYAGEGKAYDWSSTIPPEPVLAYTGLAEAEANTLAKMNDGGMDFAAIANALEESHEDNGEFDFSTEQGIEAVIELPEADVA